MKLSWIFVILLLIFVSFFSVQNAEPITVRFLTWEFVMSAALVIQLAAALGGIVGLMVGAYSRRPQRNRSASDGARESFESPRASNDSDPRNPSLPAEEQSRELR